MNRRLFQVLVYQAALICAVSANADYDDIAYLKLTDGYWQVWVMDRSGESQRQITRSASDKTRISWYPDGRSLLVNNADGRVWKAAIESGEEQAIALPLTGMLDAVLSPDGSTICFSLSTGDSVDNNNLWLVNAVTGKNERILTRMPHLQHEPAWGPDGKYIYFLSGRGGQVHDIWKVEVTDGVTEQLTVNDLYHFDVAVSIHGDLAYSSNRTGNYEIWVWAHDGEPRQVTNHPALDARPTWALDGTALAFESTRNGVQAIWLLHPETGQLTQLTKNDEAVRYPVWRQGDR